MTEQSRKFPHIYLSGNGQSESYMQQPRGIRPELPQLDRYTHSQNLITSIRKILDIFQQQLASYNSDTFTGELGFYLEFRMKTSNDFTFEKLENRRRNIELVVVKQIRSENRDNGVTTSATVYVPESAADYFLSKIKQYQNEETSSGKPRNESLVASIESIELGTARSIFTDDIMLFPEDGEAIWWEVWIRSGKVENFKYIIQNLNIQAKTNIISSVERTIFLVKTTAEIISQLVENSDTVAELRLGQIKETYSRKVKQEELKDKYSGSYLESVQVETIEGLQIIKDIPSFFLDMDAIEQADWAEELADRLIEPEQHAVAISLLDSGVTQIHPLLALGLAKNDMHTVNPSWGTNDSAYWHGHGTAMAGISLYADLFDVLVTSKEVKLLHRLESVKILPTYGENDPELYGAITEQGVFLPEIQEPNRRRVFCMAVTSGIGSSDSGAPSSWSSAIDQLCFNDNEFRRLMIISAGNIRQAILANDYLNVNDIETVENPGQAWNPLVVGAYTEKTDILDSDYSGWKPLAPSGDLSPCSRTSVIWENQWPIRPDVVFEGGNLACDGHNPAEEIYDLGLLTTHYRPNVKMFDDMRDTSCATALASHMAARIMSEQPTYEPETVRALIVHSAEWTPAMLKHFDHASLKTSKRALVRRYGYGVPNLGRALQSASNNLTLIAEDKLQPFSLFGITVKTKQMNLHKLPWPSEELEKLGEVNVELKVTLSYFIEPNSGDRGWASRHRYASHGLRFKVKSSLETDKEFRHRINAAFWNEEKVKKSLDTSQDANWFLGPKIRDCGSIHCDIWKGSAIELAEKDSIAVYPVGGWWKEKKYLERYNQISHYTLIVSVRVPGVDVDIYTPVANLVRTAVPIEV